jgi:hypothetical protein
MVSPPSAAGACRSSIWQGQLFGQEDDRDHVGQQQRHVAQHRGRLNGCVLFRGSRDSRGRILHGQEIGPVPTGLEKQERQVEADGRNRDEQLLRERERRSWGGGGEVRQHQRQHAQRNDHAQVGIRALQVVVLLQPAPAARQQRQSDYSVEDDHGDRKQRVARKRGLFWPCSIMALMLTTSIEVIASVRIKVP